MKKFFEKHLRTINLIFPIIFIFLLAGLTFFEKSKSPIVSWGIPILLFLSGIFVFLVNLIYGWNLKDE